MLHTVIPTIKGHFQNADDDYLSELRSSLSVKTSSHVNSVSDLSWLNSADNFKGYAALDLVGWEPNLPHFLPGTPYAHSLSSQRQYPDTVLKDIHDKGKKIWQYSVYDEAQSGGRGRGGGVQQL